MSNHGAFIKDIFEAEAMTWVSGCKINTAGVAECIVIDGKS